MLASNRPFLETLFFVGQVTISEIDDTFTQGRYGPRRKCFALNEGKRDQHMKVRLKFVWSTLAGLIGLTSLTESSS
jgi:hypothetical protein